MDTPEQIQNADKAIRLQPNRPRLLRSVASALCLSLSLVLLVLWIRSFYSLGYFESGLHNGYDFGLNSFQGRIELLVLQGLYDPENKSYVSISGHTEGTWQIGFHPMDEYLGNIAEAQKFIRNGFTTTIQPGFWEVSVPHYFMILVFLCLGYLLRSKPRLRFGNKDMFVIVTFFAVIIGALESLTTRIE